MVGGGQSPWLLTGGTRLTTDSLQELLPRTGRSKKQADTQKKKLYRAEKEAFAGYQSPERTIAEVDLFYKRILAHKYLRRQYRKASLPLRVVAGSGNHCKDNYQEIMLTIWGRNNEWVLLHELAHALDDKAWKTDTRGHGRRFAHIYVDLVRHVMGREWSDKLKDSFRKHGVRYNQPRTRTVKGDPAVQSQALAKAREARTAKANAKYVLVRDDGRFCKSTAAYSMNPWSEKVWTDDLVRATRYLTEESAKQAVRYARGDGVWYDRAKAITVAEAKELVC